MFKGNDIVLNKMKNIYFIRHGLAQHNTQFKLHGKGTFYNPLYYDTKLIEEGHRQATNLGKTWNEIRNIELVLTSPLMRCLQTTDNIFKGIDVPIVAIDIIKEFPQGLQTCNRRSDIDSLKPMFPKIDFSFIEHNEDILWNPQREETLDELNLRIDALNHFLNGRDEKNIAIVSHSSFIGQYKDKKIALIENGDTELLHCHPYKLNL